MAKKLQTAKNERYASLDILRALACIMVCFYHFGYIPSGFFAVSIFLSLSGFLMVREAEKDDFSFFRYYIKRLRRIYLPLFVYVSITVLIMNSIKSIPWVSLKPEAASVYLGFNSIFQMINGGDYFAAADNTVFTHLWYISILLEYEIVLPVVIRVIRKLNFIFKLVFWNVISIASVVYFVYLASASDFALGYYNPLARIFSFAFGIAVFYIGNIDIKNAKRLFILFTAVFTSICFIIFEDILVKAFMIVLSSLLSAGIVFLGKNASDMKEYKAIKWLSDISYEMYLIHFTAFYIALSLFGSMDKILLVLGTFAVSMVLSIILHKGLSFGENSKWYVYPLAAAILTVSVIGFSCYLVQPDHTKEMDALKNQILENQRLLEENQKEYASRFLEAQKEYENSENELKDRIDNIDKEIRELPITFIGDSVLLGASENFGRHFGKYYVDAEISRPGMGALWALERLFPKKLVADNIVIHLGANGGLYLDVMDDIRAKVGKNRNIYYLTVTNDNSPDVHVNDMIRAYCKNHDRTYLIDWEKISSGHVEYFVFDGLHLLENGRNAYCDAIYDAVKENELKKVQDKLDELLNAYDYEHKKTLSFFGNELLGNMYPQLYTYYPSAAYLNRNFDEILLTDELIKEKEEHSLSYTNCFVFDRTFEFTGDGFSKILDILSDSKAIFLLVREHDFINELELGDNITLIDISGELSYENYLADLIHYNADTISYMNSLIKNAVQ